jgi:outer membrane protein assembly factor BamB
LNYCFADTNKNITTPLFYNYKLPYSGPIVKPKLLWKFNSGNYQIESRITIDEKNVIYFGSNDNHVYALNPINGKLLWKFKTNSKVKSSIVSTKNDELVFTSMDGYLYTLNKDGTLKWKYNAKNSIVATPNIDKNNNIFFGDIKGYVHILNSVGDVINKFKLTTSIKHMILTDENNNFYLNNNKQIISFKKTGSINWKFILNDFIESPLVVHNYIILTSSKNWKMYALNTKGQELWNYSTAWYLTSSPVIANDTIYFGSWDWSIHSISLNKGEQIWSTQPEKSPVMSYFASGIIVDKNENIFASSRTDKIYCFNKNGNVLWKLDLKSEDILSGISLNKDGVLLIPTSEGNIYAFK